MLTVPLEAAAPQAASWQWELLLAVLTALAVAGYGLSKKSLSRSGCGAAVVSGTATFFAHQTFGMLLLAFFFTSSRVTRVNAARKRRLDGEYRAGGQRNWVQVVANSGTAAALALLYRALAPAGLAPFPLGPVAEAAGALPVFCAGAVLGHYACCNGDTWASELGILDPSAPRLCTTLRRVPPGTNGGVSLYGTAASLVGGLVVGAVAYFCVPAEARGLSLVAFGGACGVGGSLVDSLLGATVQFSGLDEATRRVVNAPGPGVRRICGRDLLDNHQVNFVSALATAALSGFAAVRVWGA